MLKNSKGNKTFHENQFVLIRVFKFLEGELFHEINTKVIVLCGDHSVVTLNLTLKNQPFILDFAVQQFKLPVLVIKIYVPSCS